VEDKNSQWNPNRREFQSISLCNWFRYNSILGEKDKRASSSSAIALITPRRINVRACVSLSCGPAELKNKAKKDVN
jgi:hypothetical protein